MSKGLVSTRIPYLAAAGAVRWDPVLGCDNSREVCAVHDECWARSLAHPFLPAFHPEVLEAPLRARKPHTIAVCFGGDLWSPGVDPEWRRQVRITEEAAPRHTYIHLTKAPENMNWLYDLIDAPNMWYGISLCLLPDIGKFKGLRAQVPLQAHRWVSFEPLLWEVKLNALLIDCRIEFVVIGGISDGFGRVFGPDEGGTRAEWVQPILDAAAEARCKVFLKNLRPIIKQLVDPRTGEPFESMNQWRDVPW
jgi:protein gp37